jgi:formyl-CoA transferase
MVRTIAGVPQIGSPVRLDRERVDSELPPPGLGEHTNGVLEALGLGSKELERLRAAHVIG